MYLVRGLCHMEHLYGVTKSQRSGKLISVGPHLSIARAPNVQRAELSILPGPDRPRISAS